MSKALTLSQLYELASVRKRLTAAQEKRLISNNSGWEDGKADRARRSLARWYRGARSDFGHFDLDYAEGYHAGVFGLQHENPWRAELLVA